MVLVVASMAGCTTSGGSSESSAKTLVVVDSDFPASFDTDSPSGGNAGGEGVVGNTYGGDIVGFEKTTADGTQIADILAAGEMGGISENFAESIEQSADKKVITITLKSGITSAAGNELTSADVVWSFERNFALKGTGLFMAQSMGLTSASDVKAIDERTVQFTLAQPNSIFFKVDAAKLYSGLTDSVEARKHVTDSDPWATAWLGKNTAGFGPYSVTAFTEGQTATFTKNPNSSVSTDFDRVILKAVPTSANRLSLLQSGEADVAMNLSPKQLLAAEKAGLAVTSYKSNKIQVMPLNTLDPNLEDARVRQAIAYAVPYDDILKSVYLGTAQPLKSPLPEDYPGYVSDYAVYDTNLAKAKDLMAQAGSSGFTLTLSYANDNYQDPLIAPLVASALKQIGIDVVLDGLPSSSFFSKMYARKGQAYLAQFWPFVADPAYALGVYYKSTSFLNVGSWENADYDSLVDQMLASSDPTARNELADQAQKIWMEQQPWILLANPGWHVAHSTSVENVTWYPNNGIRYADLQSAK
jgi:peptide/nickel transport system substrate-binding protein